MSRQIPANEDCEELNKRYGAPGIIVFRPSPTGHPFVVLANKYGTAELSLYGAHTLSYRPTGNQPVLFMSKMTDYAPGTAIRGGIPVCWPWFGACGEPGSQAHGFARKSVWRVIGSEYSEDITELTLALSSSDETKKLFPYDFELTFKISVSMKLNLSLTTENKDNVPFKITEGFHPYFRVRNRDTVQVRGVDGCHFCDARVTQVADKIWTGDIDFNEPMDHVFTLAKHEYAVIDPELHRAIAMVSRGNSKLITWNPGPTVPGQFENLAPDDWKNFVCVEPATLFRPDALEIKPGEKHELLAAIQSVPDDGSVHARG